SAGIVEGAGHVVPVRRLPLVRDSLPVAGFSEFTLGTGQLRRVRSDGASVAMRAMLPTYAKATTTSDQAHCAAPDRIDVGGSAFARIEREGSNRACPAEALGGRMRCPPARPLGASAGSAFA